MTLEMFMNDEPIQDALIPTKKCTKCEEVLPATVEYFYGTGGESLRADCKKCFLQYKKEYLASLPREVRNSRAAASVEQTHKNSPHRKSFNNARGRVKRQGKYKWFLGKAKTPEAEAYIEYLKTVTHCPDCTKKLVWYSKKIMDKDSASFDRMDSDGHYTKENVRIVCWHCNSQKSDSPADEWVGLLEVRVKKGIIKEVDPALVEYLIENKEEES